MDDHLAAQILLCAVLCVEPAGAAPHISGAALEEK